MSASLYPSSFSFPPPPPVVTAVVDRSSDVAEDTFHDVEVLNGGALHEAADIADGVGDVWARVH
jgi:hypothetical protein